MPLDKSEVTVLLDRWSGGEPAALAELMPLVFDDLRNVARKYLSREREGHTLQPTALVNEVYLRLAGRRSVSWSNRRQFFAFMAETMRRILVDHARLRKTAKRGSGAPVLPLDDRLRLTTDADPDLEALDDALHALRDVDPRQCRVVELRYFAGLSIDDVARVLDTSPSTIKREWRSARVFLFRELSRDAPRPGQGRPA